MRPPNLAYRCQCKGKQRHPSYGSAMAHIRSLAKRDMMANGTRPYTCIFCHFWHVGRRNE